MAAIEESGYYLPPPEQCFGEQQILLYGNLPSLETSESNFCRSWRGAYEALCESVKDKLIGLPPFLYDRASITKLEAAFEPFGAPSQQAKTEFENLTAAVNVTPIGPGSYNIQEVKDDTLWLSNEAKCDQVAALRIVILEWQSRPALRLLESGAEEINSAAMENGVNGKDDKNSQDKKAPILDRSIIQDDRPSFDNPVQRRKRLLRLFLSEKLFVLRTAELLVRQYFLTTTDHNKFAAIQGAEEIPLLSERIFKSLTHDEKWEQFVRDSLEALQKRIDRLDNGPSWNSVEEDVTMEELWVEVQLSEMTTILQLLFVVLSHCVDVPSSSTCSTFFRFQAKYNFFRDIQPATPKHISLVSTLQAMTTVVCVTFLLSGDIRNCIDLRLEDYATTISSSPSAAFINDPQCVNEVHSIMMDMAAGGPSPAVPSIFVWSLILLTIQESFHPSTSSGEAGIASSSPGRPELINVYEQAWNLIVGITQENPARQLAACAVDELHLFEHITQAIRSLQSFYDNKVDRSIERHARTIFLRVLKASGRLVRYGAQVLSALLAILGGDKACWVSLDDPLKGRFDLVARQFLDDRSLVAVFLDEAKARFPIESMPFLSLMTTIVLNSGQDEATVQRNLEFVQHSGRFTDALPYRFSAFEEDENEFTDPDEERVHLTADLPLFAMRNGLQSTTGDLERNTTFAVADDSRNAPSMVIQQGTEGFVADHLSRPLIISWLHSYSPLQYVAALLASCVPGSDVISCGRCSDVSPEELGQIISLLTALVTSLSQSHSGGMENYRAVANLMLGDGLFEVLSGRDLTNIVYEIFEAQLQDTLHSQTPEESLELLVQCIQFFHALTRFTPSRIWPLFARSRLLDLDGDGGSLVTIVMSIELVSGRYDFLISCIRLFEALVDAALNDAIVRPQSSKALTRFGFQARSDLLTQASPLKTKTGVIMDFLRTLVSVFDNYQNWRYHTPTDRVEIGTRIVRIFNNILRYTYSIGDSSSSKNDPIEVLQDAAEYLVDRLLSPSSKTMSNSLLEMITEGLNIAAPTCRKVAEENLIHQTITALNFCTTSLRLSMFLDRTNSAFEKDLMQNALIIVRIYAAAYVFRLPVAGLLEALILTAEQASAQPPSLLGYIGPRASKDFLKLISRLSQPHNDKEVEVSLWNLLSAVVSSRQQWFAIYVLTGVTPRERSKDQKAFGESILLHALVRLSTPSLAEYKRTTAMLRFVSLSMNNWPWAVGEVKRYSSFITGIIEYLEKIKRDNKESRERIYIKNTFSGKVTEVLAMYLHSTQQIGDTKPAKELLPKLNYLWNFGAVDPPYTPSLHVNLAKNLEQKCSGLKLSSLKQTLLFPREYGVNYFYDIDLAQKVLKANETGKSSTSNFVEDIKRANEELSVVDSQITLFKRWTLLTVELAEVEAKHSSVEGMHKLVQLTRQCLELAAADSNRDLPDSVSEQLRALRLDLVYVLLQKLTSPPLDLDKFTDMFVIAWNTIRSLQSDFENAFTKDNPDRYRLLLRILFLTIQPLVKASPKDDTTTLRMSVLGADRHERKEERDQRLERSSDLLEVLDHVVAKGFHTLSAQLHSDDNGMYSPSDFVLLTAILQSILNIPGISILYPEITQIFTTSNDTIRYATSLFSWSEKLAINGDPIYGELSVLFLLELSTVPNLAEAMAVEGVLSSLSCTNLMRYYTRPNGMGPFDIPTRLHSIWVKGILPLCLNLLDAVGAPIAAEIVSFLNQYPNQLRRLNVALANRAGMVGPRSTESHMTLGIASETHSLALISLVVEKYSAAGASMGTLERDVPQLAWDVRAAKEDVEEWVNGTVTYADRVVPANERDAVLARQAPLNKESGLQNRLEERVFEELRMALGCLNVNGV